MHKKPDFKTISQSRASCYEVVSATLNRRNLISWLDILSWACKAPEAAALKVHLDAAWRESEELRAKINGLAGEITELNKENRGLRAEVTALKERLEALNHEALLIDIGPCIIKSYKDGSIMDGMYCQACKELMGKVLFAHDGSYKYSCRRCRINFSADLVDLAFAKYQERGAEKTA